MWSLVTCFFRGPVRMPSSPCLAIPFWAIHTRDTWLRVGSDSPLWVHSHSRRAPSIPLWHQAWSLTLVWTPSSSLCLGEELWLQPTHLCQAPAPPHVDILPALGFDSVHQAAYPPHPITTLLQVHPLWLWPPTPTRLLCTDPSLPVFTQWLRPNRSEGERGRTYAHDTPRKEERWGGGESQPAEQGDIWINSPPWHVQITLSCSGWRRVWSQKLIQSLACPPPPR